MLSGLRAAFRHGTQARMLPSSVVAHTRKLSTELAEPVSAPRAVNRPKGLPRVIILGTGWGGNKLARALDKSKFDVRVISPANHFLFTPFLPSTAVGTLEFRTIQEPVRTIEGLGKYYQAKARSMDPDEMTVECEDIFRGARFKVDYDYLVIATGNKTNTFNTPGVAEREGKEVFFLKHLHHARQIRNRTLECFERAENPTITDAERKALLSFVVVGGGPTSCEFTTELHDFLRADVSRWYPQLAPLCSVTMVEAGSSILSSFDKALISYYERSLESRGIQVRTGSAVTAVNGSECDEAGNASSVTSATLSDGTELPFGMLVWSAGLAPVRFVEGLKEDGVTTAGPGRLVVDDFLRVPGEKGRVFAIGDCASSTAGGDYGHPPLAIVAEQQGQYLADCFNEHYSKFDFLGEGELPPPGPVLAPVQPPFPRFLYPRSSTFRFISAGKMASIGLSDGVVDLSSSDAFKTGEGGPKLTGFAAFLAWRGTYLSKQLSLPKMGHIIMYWLKAAVLGRCVSRF